MKSVVSLFVLSLAVSSFAVMAADTECETFKKAGDLPTAYAKVKAAKKIQTYPNVDLDAFFKATNKDRNEFINTTCDVGLDFYEIANESRSMCFNACYKESFKVSSERAKSWSFIKACGEVCDNGYNSLKGSIKNIDVVKTKKPDVIDSKRQAKEMKEIEDMIYQPSSPKKTQSK